MKIIIKITFFYLLLIVHVFSTSINDIKISGNKRISENTIVVLSKMDVDKPLDKNELNNILKNLFDTKFFKDIKIKVVNNTVFIDVIENPIIEELNINGIKKIDLLDFIQEKMTLKNKRSYEKSLLEQDLKLIENILKSSGYYFANLKASQSFDDKFNTVKINIDIDLGKKAKIKKLIFLGDKVFKDKRLKEIIASEEHKFWKFISKNVYVNEQLINLDKRLLTNYYKNNGYYNIKVQNSFVELDQNGSFNLIYNVEAGQKFYFNNFKITLPENYNPESFKKVEKKFKKIKGEQYSLYEVEDILDEINEIALTEQFEFIDATVSEKIVSNNIDFLINITESEKNYIERININGNYTTLEEVIRNALIVDEGDAFNKILFNNSLNEIRSLGIFKSVKANIEDGSDSKLKIIDINIEEQPSGEIMAGAGYGTSGGNIVFGIKEKNFMGKGVSVNADVDISSEYIRGKIDYIKPNYNYSDNTLIVSASNTATDQLDDFGYKTSELGFSLGTSFEQYKGIYFSPNLDFKIEDLETNSKATNSIKNQKGKYTDLYFNYSFLKDTRDNKYKPEKGFTTKFSQGLPMVSDSKEVSNAIAITTYKKLSRSSDIVNKVSFFGKAINALDDNVRISKRLHVPYQRLRGFEKGKVGPVDNNDFVGGNYVSTFNISTTLPNVFKDLENLDFSVFLDAANVWGLDYDKSIDDKSKIRSSTGLAVNFLTPVGPLSFSFSNVLSKSSSDKTESFRFNLGTTF